MTIFQLLKADHEKVAKIFEQLEPTTERAVKTRAELFERLKTELDAHANVEQTVLYPALQEAELTRELALEAIEEHRVVKTLLKELEALPVDSEQWMAKLTVLKENVEHHVEEEEGEMFKAARQVLSDTQIKGLTTRIEQQTAKLPSDLFLWAAVGSIGVSLVLELTGNEEKGRFVGQWVAPFLLLGLYNKLVKVAGSDRISK